MGHQLLAPHGPRVIDVWLGAPRRWPLQWGQQPKAVARLGARMAEPTEWAGGGFVEPMEGRGESGGGGFCEGGEIDVDSGVEAGKGRS